ncbi:hypothetical protein [Paraburkholderia sp. LEh10]|uniref:hypothetical protein n=1 Tax=Paraburkholderia sp. LEh10 TaxID=2821353 RepID=UPI0028ABA8B9|nr:hypothetical protein [Paraburkholderia sp. LEh10]
MLKFRSIAARDDDLRACFHETFGHFLADAGAAPGNHGNFVQKFFHGSVKMRCFDDALVVKDDKPRLPECLESV